MKSISKLNEFKWLVLILLFFVIYGFSISGIDLKYPIIIVCFMLVLLISRKIFFPKYVQIMLMFFCGMAVYAVLMSVINSTSDYFETMRFVRCAITTVLIMQIIYAFNMTPEKMFSVLKILLVLNAVSVILGIIWPQFKEIIMPISQYYKTFSPYRSSGLFDGEDVAGFFCNVGLIMETMERTYNRKSPLTLLSIVFLLATVFTARFSMLIAVIVLFFDFCILIKQKNYKHLMGLIIILAPIATIMVVMWVMTTGFGMQYRHILTAKYSFLGPLFNKLTTAYLDYGTFSSSLQKHIMVTDLSPLEYLFGAGYRLMVKQDVGYIKSLYSVGLVGIALEVGFYLRTIKKCRTFCNQPQYIIASYKIIVMMMMIMEIKNSFLFASGTFEVLLCLYFALHLSSDRAKKGELLCQ